MELEVFNPLGSMQSTKYHYAPRLAQLGGKTICELSNGDWRHQETFSLIRQLLQERFPDATFVPYGELPLGIDKIDAADIGDIVAKKGCDAVVGGNAG